MITFRCDECNTDGIVFQEPNGNWNASPCDCVANTNILEATDNLVE